MPKHINQPQRVATSDTPQLVKHIAFRFPAATIELLRLLAAREKRTMKAELEYLIERAAREAGLIA
jgi:hypothetical protein